MPLHVWFIAAALAAATSSLAAASEPPGEVSSPASQANAAPAPVQLANASATAPVPSANAPAAPAQPVNAAPAPVQLANAVTAPAPIQPKIINVPQQGHHDHAAPPRRHTADRETLMREFPDELVERMWLQDWQDIERMHQFGQLVDIVSDPDGRGIVLRLDGGSRIGELEDDDYKQMLLCRLAKPAAGLLYRVAARLRAMEGEDYVPLEITSLVRTWDYQLRLTDVNPNADRTREGVPPTHVLGMAFDIARTQMSYERQQRIETLFDQMAREGELAYYKEGSNNGLMHYHVMALPSAETQLVRAFERESFRESFRSPSYESQPIGIERARLPEAPCVTFGSSLEPFSAICSCELPLEASAGAPGAGASVSR